MSFSGMLGGGVGDEFRAPPWAGPADNVVPAAAELVVELARRADGSVAWLSAFAGEPGGVRFTITVARAAGHEEARRRRDRGPFAGDDALRVGVRFADGREAELEGDHVVPTATEPAGGIALMSRGAGGWSRRWEQQAWLWPVPPEGPLTFTSSWGEDVVVDAAPLRAAAARAIELWPDERPFWPVEDEAEDDEDDGWLNFAPLGAGALGGGPRRAPGAVGAAPMLLRTDAVAAWLSGLEATPEGLQLIVEVAWRKRYEPGDEEGPFGHSGLPFALRAELAGEEVALQLHGGEGWNSGTRRRAWLAPLPRAGTLRFVASWPEEGVAEAVVELDAALIGAAADRAVVLWPEEGA